MIPLRQRSVRKVALTPVGPDVVTQRVQDRYNDYRDLARVEGLRRLGAFELATRIVERHLDALGR